MRSLRMLLVVAVISGAADEPAPLLKPAVPGPNRVRVRIGTSEEKVGFLHIRGRVESAGGKKHEEVRIAFEVRPGRAVVTAKKWRSWGYEIPANKIGTLPELIIPGVQLAPRPRGGGRDVEVRLAGLRVEIVDPPAMADTVLGCDMLISMRDLTRQSDRLHEPRLFFADSFLELTFPASAVKRLDGEGTEPAEPKVNPDRELVPALAPMAIRGIAVFSYAAVNGHAAYKGPDGKEVPVNVAVSSTTRAPGGIIMTLGAVRGCGVELEKKEIAGKGTSFETSMVRGRLKELRLGLQTGGGFKEARDLVLRDVAVWVDKNDSGHLIWLGPEFLRAQFQDAVFTCGTDGAWRFYGRVKKEDLQDVKTRPKRR